MRYGTSSMKSPNIAARDLKPEFAVNRTRTLSTRGLAIVLVPFVRRGVGYWLLCRVCGATLSYLAGVDGVHLSTSAATLTVVASTGLGTISVVRNHERALLGTLSIAHWQLIVALCGPAALGEIAFRLLA